MTSARTPESRRRRQGTSGSAATNEASGTTTRMCQSLFSCFALENPRLLAGIGEKSLLARAMHAAHRRLETYAPGAVQLAKLAVLIRLQLVATSRNTFLVHGPQQLQRRGALVQFVVHVRVVERGTARGLVAAHVAKYVPCWLLAPEQARRLRPRGDNCAPSSARANRGIAEKAWQISGFGWGHGRFLPSQASLASPVLL